MSTELERSHSKWSNFKLTLKSILLVIFSNSIWVLLYLFSSINKGLFIGLLIANIVILLLIITSFRNFKR